MMTNPIFTCRDLKTIWITASFLFTIASCAQMESPGDSATPTSPAGDPSTVKERAIRKSTLDSSSKLQTTTTTAMTSPTGPVPVVGGVFEPDYKYPWVVRMNGCGGVILDPQWVLTAAHCVTPNIGFGKLIYTRTDPYTGAVSTETRAPSTTVGPSNNRGVFIHEQYNPADHFANDIALIKLAQPFTVTPYLQTVGVPRDPRHDGMVGTVASISHTTALPAGQVDIFRATIPPSDYQPKIYARSSTASLCPGDSGGGFVTVEYGRAIVRGIASQGTISSSNCTMPSGEAVFTDVFTHRAWILKTMARNYIGLVGNTRIRWSGSTSRGKMGVACFNPNGNLWGPLNVVGVEEGAVCEAGQTQTVMCTLDKTQTTTKYGPPVIVGFTMRTTLDGVSQVQSLPISPTAASFFGPLPPGASREFTCQVATGLIATTGALTGDNLTILSRGVEGEQTGEAIVEQPSPFDQPTPDGESK
jgi:trypsin